MLLCLSMLSLEHEDHQQEQRPQGICLPPMKISRMGQDQCGCDNRCVGRGRGHIQDDGLTLSDREDNRLSQAGKPVLLEQSSPCSSRDRQQQQAARGTRGATGTLFSLPSGGAECTAQTDISQAGSRFAEVGVGDSGMTAGMTLHLGRLLGHLHSTSSAPGQVLFPVPAS